MLVARAMIRPSWLLKAGVSNTAISLPYIQSRSALGRYHRELHRSGNEVAWWQSYLNFLLWSLNGMGISEWSLSAGRILQLYRLYKSTLWAKAGSVGSICISTNKVVGGAADNSVESESQWTWCDYLVT
jgi:hypothetical protein